LDAIWGPDPTPINTPSSSEPWRAVPALALETRFLFNWQGVTHLKLMINLQGITSIAEVIAFACVVIALIGFARWRVAWWLVFCVVAILTLIAAALVAIKAST
jgi:hypothetical protein